MAIFKETNIVNNSSHLRWRVGTVRHRFEKDQAKTFSIQIWSSGSEKYAFK